MASNSPAFIAFVNACSFQYSATILDRHQDLPDLLAIPALTMEAFSLELFLKAAHLVHGTTPGRSHDTRDLFAALPQADQDAIAGHLNSLVTHNPQYHAAVSEGFHFDVDSILRRASTLFVRLRYWHEGNLPEPDLHGKRYNAGVSDLCNAMRVFLAEINPGWVNDLHEYRLTEFGIIDPPT